MFRARFKEKSSASSYRPCAPGKAKSHCAVRWDAVGSAQAGALGVSCGQGILGVLSAVSRAWESEGEFLKTSPHLDILDVVDELPKGIREVTFAKRFALKPDEIYVIGGSFGGAAAVLATLDARVKKTIANCPVVDWRILRASEKLRRRIQATLPTSARHGAALTG